MKVLFLSTWFPYPPDNGSKLRVYHLLQGLARKHEVHLLSFAFGSALPPDVSQLSGWCATVGVVELDPFLANRAGVLRTFLSTSPVVSRTLPQMKRRVEMAFQGIRFDAVIASTEVMLPYALIAPDGVARVLEEHNSMVRWAQERAAAGKAPLERLRRWASWQKSILFTARTYPQFDLVTMVSEMDSEHTRRVLRPNGVWVETVRNGVDCDYNRSSLAAKRVGRLVFNGALTYSANFAAIQWFLAEVYGLVREARPDITLAITGDTRGVPVSKLQTDDSVIMTGRVTDIRPLVSEAEVCIAPIREGGGTRLKILEAMALGTPVVATRKAAEGLDVLHGTHLLLGDDPTSFAQQVLAVLNDASLGQLLAAAARDLVASRYDWTSISREFTRLVERSTCVRQGRRA